MAIERKKADKKLVVFIEPKKRERPTELKVFEPENIKVIPKVEVKKKVEPKQVITVPLKLSIKKVTEEEPVNPELVMDSKRVRAKSSDDKYVRFACSEYNDNFKIISERIQKNEIKFAYFAIDGDDFYHYYILTKN